MTDDRDPRSLRAEIVGRAGATVWVTGLPAAGKTTFARALERRLLGLGVLARWFDGDELRAGISSDLGFDRAARSEQSRRVAWLSTLIADLGAISIVSLISPYREDRATARAVHEASDVQFIEVFVDTPLEECMARDPKGLYAKARAGAITQFTGVDDPYEPPAHPELHLRGGAVADSVERLVAMLGLVPDPS